MQNLLNQKLNFEKLLDQQHRILKNMDVQEDDPIYQIELKFIRQLNFRLNQIKNQILKSQ